MKSIIRRLWRWLPTVLLGTSLLLHLVTVTLYVRLPVRFAAFTVFPIWVWGIIGLSLAVIPYLFFRKSGSLLLTVIWLITILLLADEARSFGRVGIDEVTRGPAPPHAGSKVLRVATLNCGLKANPAKALDSFEPDIVFLQEVTNPYFAKMVVDELFDGQGDYRHDALRGCAVAVRGSIRRNLPVTESRCQLVEVEMYDGRRLELVNIHLQSAATNLRLYDRECWWEHRKNRTTRQVELSYILAHLEQRTSYPRFPTIIAGDFNAPANDLVYRMLKKNFTDAFDAVGTGWGNTYHRKLPLLRIDQIYGSSKLIPVRSQAFTVSDTDHRLVIADFIFR